MARRAGLQTQSRSSRGRFMAKIRRQSKKTGVGSSGMAHFGSLLAWLAMNLPAGLVGSGSPMIIACPRSGFNVFPTTAVRNVGRKPDRLAWS